MTTATQTAVSTWNIDTFNSSAEFAVKHMMVSTVRGRMMIAEGVLNIDEADLKRSRVSARLDAASIATGVEQRDAHLRSDDFLNAEQYPYITFESVGLEPGDGDGWKLAGNLTIRDVTRPVVLDVELEGRGIDAFGKERVGFTATAKVNRKDFGVNWNQAIEFGGVAVADTVKITLNIAAVRAE